MPIAPTEHGRARPRRALAVGDADQLQLAPRSAILLRRCRLQEPAHDLAAGRLRQVVDDLDDAGHGTRPCGSRERLDFARGDAVPALRLMTALIVSPRQDRDAMTAAAHGRMQVQHLLHLARPDLEAGGDDRVLGATTRTTRCRP